MTDKCTCSKDVNGREYTHCNSIKTGDKLEVDDGFTCMDKGEIKEVFFDKLSGFYVKCNGPDGKGAEHYLNSQENDTGYLIGMYKV